jgi:hypothetical protein
VMSRGCVATAWAAAGDRLGYRRAVQRFVGLVLAVLPLMLGLVPMLVTDRRRGLQDLLADTVVIHDPDRRAPRPGPQLLPGRTGTRASRSARALHRPHRRPRCARGFAALEAAFLLRMRVRAADIALVCDNHHFVFRLTPRPGT